LRLLDDRQREVDAMLEDARERALVIKEEAEQRAQQITADAERQRAELEEQVAALRSEVAALREDLARATKTPAVPTGAATVAAAEPALPTQATAQLEATEISEAADAAGTPRWGRPSTIAGPQQAVRGSRSARRRWLPPWVPFVIVLLVLLGAGAVVATQVDGQAGSRIPSVESTGAGLARSSAAILSAASITSGASVIVAAAQAVATLTPTTVRQTPTNTTAPSTPTLTPQSPTIMSVRQTLTLPPSGARLGTPLVPPGDAGPDGPIVAAYTMYATYTVRPGDTLNKIASMFGVPGQTIMRSSGLVDPNLLLPGQVLTIPRESGWLYRVQPGDTLELIGLRFGLSVDDLMSAGNRTSADVRLGDLVFIPDRGTSGVPKRQ
jgi:LysM repeat protein/vacuolar-type H+-ATPase subunit H